MITLWAGAYLDGYLTLTAPTPDCKEIFYTMKNEDMEYTGKVDCIELPEGEKPPTPAERIEITMLGVTNAYLECEQRRKALLISNGARVH